MCSDVKGCSRQSPTYLKDLMIPSERLHVHGNKQLLPRERIDIFKTSFSFSDSLARNSLPHYSRRLSLSHLDKNKNKSFHSPDNLTQNASMFSPLCPCEVLPLFSQKINFENVYFHAFLYSFTFLVVIILMRLYIPVLLDVSVFTV